MDPKPMKSLLIVKLSAIGDVIHALPVAEAIRERWPDIRLDWVVESAAADVLIGHPAVDNVFVSRRRRWLGKGGGSPLKRMSDIWRFVRLFRRERYDVVIDLQGLLKSGVVTFLARAGRKVGFAGTRELSWIFVRDRMPPYDPDRHAVDRYLDAAKYLGAETDRPKFRLGLGPAERAVCDSLLADFYDPKGDEPLVVVHPAAKWDTKQWLPGHWARVCDGLEERLGARVVVTGSVHDRAFIDQILDQTKHEVLDLTGRTSLRTLAELFTRARAVICPDTGTMHLAAATGTPVVALFGPTAPWRTGPAGPEHRVIRLSLACGPCFKKKCSDPRCMSDIAPSWVLTEAGEIFRGDNE